jgi:hypothetical protein
MCFSPVWRTFGPPESLQGKKKSTGERSRRAHHDPPLRPAVTMCCPRACACGFELLPPALARSVRRTRGPSYASCFPTPVASAARVKKVRSKGRIDLLFPRIAHENRPKTSDPFSTRCSESSLASFPFVGLRAFRSEGSNFFQVFRSYLLVLIQNPKCAVFFRPYRTWEL